VIHLVTGGARSGKSTFALEQALAIAPSGPVGFIATAAALDEDMAERIRRHKAERDDRFITFEAALDLGPALADPAPRVFIVDCLTLWCSNLLFDGSSGEFEATRPDPVRFERAVAQLEGWLGACGRPVLLVTNEVGLGIVPPDAISRTYRDWLGRVNQRVARLADHVTLLVSGIPLVIKAGPG
jgi:adenosylcobinamide kinase/adenosylcobinamide-phosphate guanylyltransferase